MDSHQLADRLYELPKGEVDASIDIDTGVLDKHGDVITAKVFASSIVVATRYTLGLVHSCMTIQTYKN